MSGATTKEVRGTGIQMIKRMEKEGKDRWEEGYGHLLR
jgi:hypothetical protein